MANNEWQTPPEIFTAFDYRFNFTFDLAATHENAKCPRYFTQEEDALSQDWFSAIGLNKWGWLNCPYSNPLPWVDESINAQRNGAGVVMLLNDDPSVRWFNHGVTACSEIWHFISNDKPNKKEGYRNGRIAFLDGETGEPCKDNNKPQCAFIFDPHRIGDQQTRYVVLEDFENQGRELIKNRYDLAA